MVKFGDDMVDIISKFVIIDKEIMKLELYTLQR